MSELKISYRPDIDGLRAIAVLGVILYHAYPSTLPGGFVGVDVFFVISGYLITSIIFSSLARAEFSFIEFYCSRVRRIYPALLIVVVFVEVVGYFGMLPDELKLLGGHSIGGMFFFSNIIYYFESGYFDVASHLKPLLHLWSLGIEEQYYLFWPLLVYFIYLRFGKLPLVFIISTLLVVSFVLGVVFVQIDKEAAFYLLPFRFWELAVGALLAVYIEPAINRISSQGNHVYSFIRSSVGCLGFFIIILSFFFLNSDLRFPGYYAAAPVIGAMFVILSGAKGWVNKYVLSRRSLVSIGLISYPLYLWHWPILSYQTLFSYHAPSLISRLLAVLSSFLLAFLTYQFVERRVRRWLLRPTVAVLIFFSFCVAMIGGGFNKVNLNPSANMAYSDLSELRWPEPLASNKECKAVFNFNGRFCALYNDYPVKVAVIGDSHANHFSPGLAKLYAESKVGLVNLGATGCAPVNNVSDFVGDKGCINIPIALDMVKKNEEIKIVFLAARWSGSYINHLEKLQAGLVETIKDLQRVGKKVVILDEVPIPKFDIRTCVKNRPFMLDQQSKESKDCTFDRQQYEKNAHSVRELLSQVTDSSRDFLKVDLLDHLCSEILCDGRYHGRLLYRDPTHFSMSGSLYAAYLIGLKLNSYSDNFVEVESFNQKFSDGSMGLDTNERNVSINLAAMSIQPQQPYEATLEEGIDFKKPLYPTFIAEVKGMSGYEPNFRWSDANNGGPIVKFIFKKPLPKKFTLEIVGGAFTNNKNVPVKVRVGDIEETFVFTDPKVPAKGPILYSLSFETDGKFDILEITPPKPTSPNELNPKSSDKRKLGIAFTSIKIKS